MRTEPLTAVTAAVPIPPLYLETVLLPESAYVGRTGQLVLLWVIFGLIGLTTFLLPLLGAHRLLEREKERVQSETVGRIEAVLAQMHSRVESGDYGDVESTTSMKNLLDSLIVERNLLQQVSTWPWNPETPRILATALILPILLLLISQIITRLFGP